MKKLQTKTSENEQSEWPNGVSYEIFVRSFADSNGDGIGDINGITAKLDYLKTLGIEAMWLTPIYPSPSYHKYDVTNYKAIDPEYGTLADLKKLILEAHHRNIKVILDLVLNHSSEQHPWFKEALKGKDNPYHNYYVWSNSNDLKESKKWYYPNIENQKNKGDEKYYAYFWSGMPDLNYDNPRLREEMIDIAKFWLEETDVDGFRLDAAQYIFGEKDVKQNVHWWQEFRIAISLLRKNIYLVGEVWNKDTIVAKYMNKALSACFNFDLALEIQLAARSEKSSALIEKVIHIRKLYLKSNPNFIDATMLSNHDQNRILSALNGDLNQAGIAASLLLTLPGSPYIYYGEEIGMAGQKPDENIREPFLWAKGKKDKMQTSWLKAAYSNEQTVAPLAEQMIDSNSFWNHYRSLIEFRNKNKIMRFGEIATCNISNPAVCAFYRIWQGQSILVVHNLSKKEVNFELPLNEHSFSVVEFISGEKYKRIKNKVRLSPYSTIVLSSDSETK